MGAFWVCSSPSLYILHILQILVNMHYAAQCVSSLIKS
jgi:hypothetical protein